MPGNRSRCAPQEGSPHGAADREVELCTEKQKNGRKSKVRWSRQLPSLLTSERRFTSFTSDWLFSVWANGWVEVNDDLTSYLPDTTETRQGLDTMEAEFTTFGTNRIMVDNIDYARASLLAQRLETLEGVKSVEFDDTEDQTARRCSPSPMTVRRRTR